MKNQAEKGEQFVALHRQRDAFVIPNPWDAGSASMLQALGFKALATSSAASAGTLGRKDYELTREEALSLAERIVQAVDIPVSADLENGFGDSPEVVAETVKRAASIGLAGCSIEDARGDAKPYDLSLAVERITAAAEVVRALPCPFVLTARAENFLRGVEDLDDTVRRLQAFEAAGAAVLFPVGLPDLAAYQTVCSAVSKPVNGIAGFKGQPFTLGQLAAAGVRRVSLATALWRAAMTALRDAATEVKEHGSFEFSQRTLGSAEIAALFHRTL